MWKLSVKFSSEWKILETTGIQHSRDCSLPPVLLSRAVRFIFQTWTIYHRPCPPLTKSAAKMELVKNIKARSFPVNESEPRLEERNIVTLAHVRLLPVPWTFPFWEIAMALGKIARPTELLLVYPVVGIFLTLDNWYVVENIDAYRCVFTEFMIIRSEIIDESKASWVNFLENEDESSLRSRTIRALFYNDRKNFINSINWYLLNYRRKTESKSYLLAVWSHRGLTTRLTEHRHILLDDTRICRMSFSKKKKEITLSI